MASSGARTTCGLCGKANPPLKCGACQLVKYCSTECQAAHWKRKPDGHKQDCKQLRKLRAKQQSVFEAPPPSGTPAAARGPDSSATAAAAAATAATAATAKAANNDAAAAKNPTRPGARVAICGLKSRPELNGEVGVCGAATEEGRTVLALDDGRTVSVKPSNLEEVECPICLGGCAGGDDLCGEPDVSPLVRKGCGCRGAAGYAHIRCVGQ